MKHIDPVKLSALADNEYTLNKREEKHLKECRECEKIFLEMKSLKQAVKSSKLSEDSDFEIAIDYSYSNKKKEAFRFTYGMSFLFLFLISFMAGIAIAGTIKTDNENYTKRNEFREMGSKYAGKQYVFPFK